MSAPDTNVEKQAKNHFGPIIGITAGVIFALIIVIAYVFFIATPEDDTPDNTPTGEAIQTDGNATIRAEDDPNAPLIEAPESDGPATTRGAGPDGEIEDALPSE